MCSCKAEVNTWKDEVAVEVHGEGGGVETELLAGLPGRLALVAGALPGLHNSPVQSSAVSTVQYRFVF